MLVEIVFVLNKTMLKRLLLVVFGEQEEESLTHQSHTLVAPGFPLGSGRNTDTASFEHLIARLTDGRGKFYQVWSHFLHFIQFQLTSAP